MGTSHLAGKAYLNLVRCSKDEQADTSPADQKNILTDFASQFGLKHAGGEDFVSEGVTGSVPAARSDIEKIIKRKREQDDFEILLVQDFSRFTRVGLDHGGALKWDLAKEGIEVIFVTFGTTGDADQDALFQGVGFFSAQQQAKSMSYNSTRGQMSSMKAGNLPHTFHIPFGIDRLYVGMDGKPRHRIRNLPDGTQQKLEVDRDVVIAVFARNPEKGASVHYHRQSDEQVVLVPGDPCHVEVVRRIYQMKLVEGKGPYLIARALNNECIASPKGLLWNTFTIESILANPTYTGVGIADRYATGIYNVRGKSAAPQPVQRSLVSIAQRKKSHLTIRPKDEWRWQPYPHLVDYLGASLRELAVEHHQKGFEKQVQKSLEPKKKLKRGGDSHGNSPYLLKGILRSKQGGSPMYGTVSGQGVNTRRYYKTRHGISTPKSGLVLAKMIPAEPLERAVLDVVIQVLLDVPNLRQRIEKIAEEQLAILDADRNELRPLLNERKEIQAKLEDYFAMGTASRRALNSKREQWENRLLAIEERINQAEASATAPELNIDALVSTTAKKLAAMSETLKSLNPTAIRSVLASLITKLEVNLETREVAMELTLPEGVNLRNNGGGPLCVEKPTLWHGHNHTQWMEGLKIAVVTCQGQRGYYTKPACFVCSRRAA